MIGKLRHAWMGLLGALLIFVVADGARAQQGLWVGEVTIDRVSQSTPLLEDSSFDLQLTALRDGIDPETNELIVEETALLIPARASWQYDASGADRNQTIADDPCSPACDPALDWRLPEHPPLGSTGDAEFGFGDGGDEPRCVDGPQAGQLCTVPGPSDSVCNADGTTSYTCAGGISTQLSPTPRFLDFACANGPNAGLRCSEAGTTDLACNADATTDFVCAASPLARTPAVYFRTSFEFPPPGFSGDLADVDRVVASLLVDDGAIVHLNGEEVLRVNMPPRPGSLGPAEVEPSHALRPITSVQGSDESFFVEHPKAEIDQEALKARLVPGTNWIGVELHQREFVREDPLTTDPTGVARPFAFRVILHVGDTITPGVRLLKDVIQLRDPSTQEIVLITRPERVPDFSPVELVNGRPFGYRVSTAAFDFDCVGAEATRYSASCDTTNDALVVAPGSAAFGDAGTILGPVSLTDPYDAPTNPFVHRYHPDHDNLDAEFLPIFDAGGNLLPGKEPESLEVERQITFTFDANDPLLADRANPAEEAPPDWQSSVVGGRYEETITGLHQTPIRVEGTFRLVRGARAGNLNPAVSP